MPDLLANLAWSAVGSVHEMVACGTVNVRRHRDVFVSGSSTSFRLRGNRCTR